MINYVCKYTPLEIFEGFHVETKLIDSLADDFDLAGKIAHDNLCGYGKSMMQTVIYSKAKELILDNCCDAMRRLYEVIKEENVCDFMFFMNLPHRQDCCSAKLLAKEFIRLKKEYEEYSGIKFDKDAFINAISSQPEEEMLGDYIGILGVRCSKELEDYISSIVAKPIKNLTCARYRNICIRKEELINLSEEELFTKYAACVLAQFPCGRMGLSEKRREIFNDPNLKGIIYHTIKFCDYYEYEYAHAKEYINVPILKLETDYTKQSEGQLKTRIEAFAETLSGTAVSEICKKNEFEGREMYVAGIDSGSTSTDVVIMNQDKKIIAAVIIPTGGGASISADNALKAALEKVNLPKDAIKKIVKTGYGRDYINDGDESVTEISCHAKGANFLNPNARTVIDIGGQDSKAIKIDEQGAVKNFVMNDKCAAGTGRFLEMMARALGISLEEMSKVGLKWKKDISISSMCTVFAESEVVSLVAQNIPLADIIHGLNNSVASKVCALVQRIGLEEEYIMTGGVANNEGVVKAIEENLKSKIFVCEEAQICGAIGAALFALEKI